MQTFIPLLLCALVGQGCASYWQASRLEEKLDRLVKNTRRETLSEIFGEQSRVISKKVEDLSAKEQNKLDDIIDAYERGSSSIEEVRGQVMSSLGGSDRVVASSRGIWLRDDGGTKLLAVSRNTSLTECKQVSEDELPDSLASNRRLKKYTWGIGQYKGQKVLFPWRLTMSKFTKEIVENTAKETARQILKMSGDKGWNRPVYIQVSTNAPGELKVAHQGEDEIYVETKSSKKSVKVKTEKDTAPEEN
ncbi:MAG: hypothetical protein VYC39_00770 [Myxococcota bacterium]|nr:hypothetical protein [Myxococcota bacterium]